MTRADLKTKHLPDTPGVYFFLGTRKEILYIGKATSLKNRVRSYFAADLAAKRSPLIERMVAEAKGVEVTETESTLEALILETNLIRTHKPRYNTRSRDDKSFNHLVVTKEAWPRVLVVRGKDLAEGFQDSELQFTFGPFPSGQLFKEALKIVKRIFAFYDTKQPVGSERSRLVRGQIDFNRQLGLYPAGDNNAAYQRTIRHLILFFSGRKRDLIGELTVDMHRYAAQEAFEHAAAAKRQIFALEHIHDIALIKDDQRHYRDDRAIRIEAYDVAHLQGAHMVGVMTVIENEHPQPSAYRTFNVRSLNTSNDPAALAEILTRRLNHSEWPMPQLIVVDGGVAQKRAAERVLRKQGLVVPVVAVVKNEQHRPVRLLANAKLKEQFGDQALLANSEAHRFSLSKHRAKRRGRLR